MKNESILYQCSICRVFYVKEDYHEGMECKVCGSDSFEIKSSKDLRQIVEEASKNYEKRRVESIKERTPVIYPGL